MFRFRLTVQTVYEFGEKSGLGFSVETSEESFLPVNSFCVLALIELGFLLGKLFALRDRVSFSKAIGRILNKSTFSESSQPFTPPRHA